MNGWYYDEQLHNPLTSITLHPNKKFDKNSGEWVGFTENCDSNCWPGGTGYSYTPIAEAILTEDFNISMANTWTPVADGTIENLWSSIRTIAPYAPVITNVLGEIAETAEKRYGTSKANGNSVTAGASRILDSISTLARDGLEFITPRLNYSLVTQGTRFSYYSGSGVAFGNLGLKYTLFPRIKEDGTFESTISQAENLFEYTVGKFEHGTFGGIKDALREWVHTSEGMNKLRGIGKDVSEWLLEKFSYLDSKLSDVTNKKISVESATGEITSWIKETTDGTLSKVTNVADETLADVDTYFAGLISWQKPPGGYKPTYKDIDCIQEGTLQLKIGTQYSIHSLLCQDCTTNFSRIMVKDPTGGTTNLTPLFCDVNITLTPSTKFSDISLKKFIEGNSRKYEAGTELDKKLRLEQELLRKTYNQYLY